MQLHSYGKPAVPEGVEVVDAEQTIPESQVFANPREKHSFAGFSNIFRYRLLQELDAVWFDADVLCWNWDLAARPYIFGYENERGRVNGAVLSAPRESKLLSRFLEKSREIDTSRFRWGQLGPGLITETVEELDLQDHTLPQKALYQLDLHSIWKIWDPREADSLQSELDGSSAIHMWNSVIWNAAPELANSAPPRGSLIHRLAADVGIDIPRETVSTDWLRSVARKRFVRYLHLGPRIQRRLRYRLR